MFSGPAGMQCQCAAEGSCTCLHCCLEDVDATIEIEERLCPRDADEISMSILMPIGAVRCDVDADGC